MGKVTRSNAEEHNGIVYWLGASAAASRAMRSDFDVIRYGHNGIPRKSLDNLAGYLGISKKNMAENIFSVSAKTLERKDPQTKLDKRISSHAIEIARVVQHAYEVFCDIEKVKRWLNVENRALNNMKPVQLFDTLTGINMVNDILGRIEEGVYS